MADQVKKSADKRVETNSFSVVELVIFHVGNMTCALHSIEVKEIIKSQIIRTIPHAPDFVKGVINLRGNIVTIIDMRKKFQLPVSKDESGDNRIIIVNFASESVGLLVDAVDDILIAASDDIEKPPSNEDRDIGLFLNGVYKMASSLVAILNLDELLKMEETGALR